MKRSTKSTKKSTNATKIIQIKLVGFEDSQSSRRVNMEMTTFADASFRLYGYRIMDKHKRMVGVEISPVDAVKIVRYASRQNRFPDILVDNDKWFYVAALGKDEAIMVKNYDKA